MQCGLDIGTYTIKAVHCSVKNQKYVLEHWGEIAVPPTARTNDKQKNILLAQTIKNLWREAKISTQEVGVAVSETNVYSRVIELPFLSDIELASAIEYEAEQYIPFPLSEVQIEYFVLDRKSAENNNKTEVLLFAAKKKAIEDLTKLLEMADLSPVFIETEILALNRALIYPDTSLLINLGARNTNLAVVKNQEIKFIYNFEVGGEALTRALMQTLSLEASQAEEYKKTYGLNESALEGKISQALIPVFNQIIEQIQKTLNYYFQNTQENVKRLVLTGGTAEIPEITTYLTKSTGLETVLGNPFGNFASSENLPASLMKNASRFAVAVGLALRQT